MYSVIFCVIGSYLLNGSLIWFLASGVVLFNVASMMSICIDLNFALLVSIIFLIVFSIIKTFEDSFSTMELLAFIYNLYFQRPIIHITHQCYFNTIHSLHHCLLACVPLDLAVHLLHLHSIFSLPLCLFEISLLLGRCSKVILDYSWL